MTRGSDEQRPEAPAVRISESITRAMLLVDWGSETEGRRQEQAPALVEKPLPKTHPDAALVLGKRMVADRMIRGVDHAVSALKSGEYGDHK